MGKEGQIYIRGFARSIKEDDLRDSFKEFGDIQEIKMVGAYAFITFQKIQDAQAAVSKMDGEKIDGSKLTVEIAGKRKKTNGPQPDDICRSCHKKGHWKNSCPYRRSRYRRSSSSRSRSRSESSRRNRSRRHKHKRDKKRRRSSSSQSDSSSSRSRSSSSSESRSQRKKKQKRSKHNSKKNKQKKKQTDSDEVRLFSQQNSNQNHSQQK